MIITGLDFILINCLTYVCGVASGLIICCKYKDQILLRSRSRDNLSSIASSSNQLPHFQGPVIAAAQPAHTPPNVTKITLE